MPGMGHAMICMTGTGASPLYNISQLTAGELADALQRTQPFPVDAAMIRYDHCTVQPWATLLLAAALPCRYPPVSE